MTYSKTALAVFFAAALAPSAMMAAPASPPSADDQHCRQPAAEATTGIAIDCTATGSVEQFGGKNPDKAKRYPDGAVNFGAGIWF